MSRATQKTYVKHVGAPYRFGDEILILAPLPLEPLKQAIADGEALKGSEDYEENTNHVCRVVHASLSLNYPEITIEDVKTKLINSWNMNELLGIILFKSGLTVKPTDEVMTLEKYRELMGEASN